MSNTETKVIYSIFPAIGIARVGNSVDEYYIGPETCNGLPILPDGAPFEKKDFRDAKGAVRRQAARFSVMQSTDGGKSWSEVTAGVGAVKSIQWHVHLANKKASWYKFQTKSGETGYPPNQGLRNASVVTTEERLKLIIDPGPRSISGQNQHGKAFHFSRDTIPPGYAGGSFPPETLSPDTIDTLGELRTDAQGRLLVLGGLGHAGTTEATPSLPTYANNDHWWDDTSDGPVQATLIINNGTQDLEVEAESAWVLCGPPSYAPQIANIVTLYDTIFDALVRYREIRPDIFVNGLWKLGAEGYRPYFETDIRPIFERAAGYPWVTAIPPKPHKFDFDKLGNPEPTFNGFRQYYLDFIRPPGGENILINANSGATMMPYLAGDDSLSANTPGVTTAATSKYERLTDTQYFFLLQWAGGYFRSGAEPVVEGERLTRAVLENCVGGAFSPGIEMTWISRNPAIYTETPFRIKVRKNIPDPLSLGFDPELGMEPGDILRYMAVPWQADFNQCSAQTILGRFIWWWPAQRPEYVYLEPKATPTNAVPGPHVGPQVPWIGTSFDQNAADYISFASNVEMVEKWDKLGFVFNIGSDTEPHFVEVERKLPRNEPISLTTKAGSDT